MNINNKYYRLRDLCIEHYIPINIFDKYIIKHSKEALIQNNIFRYGVDFCINIPTFYKLAILHERFDVFNVLINNIDRFPNIFININNILSFSEDKYYVYVFNCFTKLKIGYTTNIITRLKAISNETNECTYCEAIFEYDTKKEAYLIEQTMLSKFNSYIIKGEYLSNSPDIVDTIKNLLNTRLIPVFS